MTTRAYFYGCAVAHGGHRMHPHDGGPWPWPEIDGNFAPGAVPHGRTPTDLQDEHRARLYHRDGWTMISFWDRSVDSRYNSNGNFIIEGVHDFAGACELAKAVFPIVWERVAPLVEVR